MYNPKTIKGYISMIKKIEKISPQYLKGFDDLDDEQQFIVVNLDVEISNWINEIVIDQPNKQENGKKNNSH
ncbi:hypothetical protein [Flagellimonas flava]|uniref:hypothetical protein n=1 Tax=Flagellimonas flava TaxID=570519 RepID=UPI003D660455